MQIQQTPPVRALPKVKNALASPPLSSAQTRNYGARIRAISVNELPPNAFRRKREPKWRGGFSLGVDLGMSRTGLALSKGFNIRPLSVIILQSMPQFQALVTLTDKFEIFVGFGVAWRKA